MAKVSKKNRVNPTRPHPQGRPSNAYRIWCEAQALHRDRLKAIQDTVRDPESKHFATMNIHLDGMAFGRPLQQVQVEDTTPVKPMTGHDIARRLLDRLPLLLAGQPDLAQRLSSQAAIDAEFTVEE